jgi:hypothetical protein
LAFVFRGLGFHAGVVTRIGAGMVEYPPMRKLNIAIWTFAALSSFLVAFCLVAKNTLNFGMRPVTIACIVLGLFAAWVAVTLAVWGLGFMGLLPGTRRRISTRQGFEVKMIQPK